MAAHADGGGSDAAYDDASDGGAAADGAPAAAGAPESISQEPINVLFASHSSVAKRDVWEIDLIQILDMLVRILEKSDKKDLRVAGMAALSSSLIYRMKVESISALHRAAMERGTAPVRRDPPDIEMIGIPYRHESTYPVSLDDLLAMLQNLIGTMANPRSRPRRRSMLEPAEPPAFENYMLSLESEIDAYRDMIMAKIAETGRGILQDITANLNAIDSIKCFFAALFLARDRMVDLEQAGDDIRITAIPHTEGMPDGGADSDGGATATADANDDAEDDDGGTGIGAGSGSAAENGGGGA